MEFALKRDILEDLKKLVLKQCMLLDSHHKIRLMSNDFYLY